MTPVGFGEPGERQNVVCGLVEVVGCVEETDLVEMVDDTTMLSLHRDAFMDEPWDEGSWYREIKAEAQRAVDDFLRRHREAPSVNPGRP